jgi:hypothetical protein
VVQLNASDERQTMSSAMYYGSNTTIVVSPSYMSREHTMPFADASANAADLCGCCVLPSGIRFATSDIRRSV